MPTFASKWVVTITGIATLGLLLAPAGLVTGCRKKERQQASWPLGQSRAITTPTGIDMVLIPAGEFMMGSDRGDADERPVHKVHVDAFYMDTYEVTQKSYQSLLGANPSKFKGPDKPVDRVGWQAAIAYCNARSQREGRRPCYDPKTQQCDFNADGYRLPTEAEWEYACRGGTETDDPFGARAAPSALSDQAWYGSNADQSSHPVGQKRPNAFGLYDVLGNVAEWCNDFYGPEEYAAASARGAAEPSHVDKGPAGGDYRVVRGGSWKTSADRCRPAARQGESEGSADACIGYEVYGFRCVRNQIPLP